MTNKNKILALSVAGIAALGITATLPFAVSAQLADTDRGQEFIQQLAEKLGMDEADVESAVTELREERQAERQAEREAAIAEAVENGDLTSEEAEILAALGEIQPDISKPTAEEFEAMQALSEEERQALREEKRAEKQQAVVDALAEQGINITTDELETLREKVQELGIGGHGPRDGRGHRGMQ